MAVTCILNPRQGSPTIPAVEMMTMLRSMVPAMLASMAVASVLEAQAVPVVALTKPEAEFAEPFDQVSGVRELSNGRVVVADQAEPLADTLLIDSLDSDVEAVQVLQHPGCATFLRPSGPVKHLETPARWDSA